MMTVLALAVIPAVLAVSYHSPAMALLAVAGLLWAVALSVCSAAPVLPGREVTLTETVATGLSTVAGIVAGLGLLLLLIPAM